MPNTGPHYKRLRQPGEGRTVLSVQVPPAFVKRLKTAAEADDRTVSQLVRVIINQYLDTLDAAGATS